MNDNPSTQQDFKPFGKYRIERKLGQGGMGEVYLAYDTGLNRKVALKVLLIQEGDAVERFNREARAAAKLNHPNIVKIHDVGSQDKLHFYAMEYVNGDSLQDLISNPEKRVSPKQLAEIICRIASALDYAHKEGIVHRDIKPSNILIDTKGAVYLTDFGLAKELSGLDHSLTASGTVLGTPDYMSPEQARGEKSQVDGTSDVFSLGATLYHGLTGSTPFAGDHLYMVLDSVVNKEPVSPTHISPMVHRDLETICLKCLEKDKSRRYRSAGELAEDLQRFINGEPISARPKGFATNLLLKVRKNKIAFFSVSVSILVIAVITALYLAADAKKKRETEEYRRQAKAFFAQGRIEDASSACEKLLAVLPDDTEMQAMRTQCAETLQGKKAAELEAGERRAQAKAILDRINIARTTDEKIAIGIAAFSHDPTFGEALQAIAYAYKEKSDPVTAYKYFTKAIETTPTLAYSYYECALYDYHDPAKREQALKYFQKVIELDPLSPIAFQAKGNVEEYLGKKEEALDSYSKAIELNPKSYRLYYTRGNLYAEYKRDYVLAIKDFTRAIELDPSFTQSYIDRGRIYNTVCEHQKAFDDFKIAEKKFPNDSELLFGLGLAYLKMGDDKLAIEYLTRILNKNPGYAEGYAYRSRAYLAEAKYSEALSDAEKALELLPPESKERHWYYSSRGDALRFLNYHDKAIEDYTESLDLNAKNYCSYYGRGVCYHEKEQYEKALENLNKAIELAPDFDLAYNARGMSFAELGLYDMANKDFTTALNLAKSGQGPIYYNRAKTYFVQKLTDLALADINKAIEYDLRFAYAYYTRGLIFVEKVDLENAYRDFTTAIELNIPIDDVYHKRGFVSFYKEDYNAAIKDFRKKLETSPDSLETLKFLAMSYANNKDPDNAIIYCTKAIGLSPKDVELYNDRGFVYIMKKDYDSAIRDFTAALELSPYDARFVYSCALCYSMKKDFDKAIAGFNRAEELNPLLPLLHRERAYVFHEKGELDKAMADINREIELSPKDYSTYDFRGWLHILKKDFDAAISDLDKCIELAPDFYNGYDNRGLAYFNKGETDKAVNDFTKALELKPDYEESYYNRALAYARKNEYEKAVNDGQTFLKLAPDHKKYAEIRKLLEEWKIKIKE